MANPLSNAVAHMRLGRFAEAETIAHSWIDDPEHKAEAWHVLGVAALHLGRSEEALKRFDEAIALRNVPGFHLNRGLALCSLKRFSEAIDAFRRTVELAPEFPEASNNLANVLHFTGRSAEAEIHWRTAIRLRPDYANKQPNTPNTLLEQANFEEVIEQVRTVLAIAPDSRAFFLFGKASAGLKRDQEAAEAFLHTVRRDLNYVDAQAELSLVLARLGRNPEAEDAIREAIRLRPNDAALRNALASMLATWGRVDEAFTEYDTALRLQPDFADALHNKAKILIERGVHAPANDLLRLAIAAKPEHREAYLKLSLSLVRAGELDEALAVARNAVEKWPNDSQAWAALGDTLVMRGDLNEGRAALERAVLLAPKDPVLHSNLLCILLAIPEVDECTLDREHQNWLANHAQFPLLEPTYPVDRDPDRPLRIGWVSRDFGRQILSRFLVPFLVHLDPKLARSLIYSDQLESDDLARSMRRFAAEWRTVGGMSDNALARQIHDDRIDFLIDLDGHCGGRLGVFARRPAPIQVSYLGYPHRTGLPEIDYRLTDAVADPPGTPEGGAEKPVRLPRGFGCFAPRLDSPQVVAPPCGDNGPITFGSTHKPMKLNDQVLDLWAKVLHAVPESRLLAYRDTLKGSVADGLRRKLVERGIANERIGIRNPNKGEDYLQIYSEIDILLDTFPWCGHATACESLWQGVPVLTLKGNRYSGRMTASVLHQVGLDDWAVDSPEEYVSTAVRWSRNRMALAELRAGLREKVRTSAAANGKIFTRELEAAFRKLWRDFCSSRLRL